MSLIRWTLIFVLLVLRVATALAADAASPRSKSGASSSNEPRQVLRQQQKKLATASMFSARPLRGFILLGQQMRQEKNTINEYETRMFRDYILGAGYSDFNLSFEKSIFADTSGNQTLNVDRQYESNSVWLQYEISGLQWGIPFFSAGFGFSREINETRLYANSSLSTGDWKQLGGVGCGFRAPLHWVWLGAEARLVSAEAWNPNTSVYLLGRVGFVFQ